MNTTAIVTPSMLKFRGSSLLSLKQTINIYNANDVPLIFNVQCFDSSLYIFDKTEGYIPVNKSVELTVQFIGSPSSTDKSLATFNIKSYNYVTKALVDEVDVKAKFFPRVVKIVENQEYITTQRTRNVIKVLCFLLLIFSFPPHNINAFNAAIVKFVVCFLGAIFSYFIYQFLQYGGNYFNNSSSQH